MNISSSQSFAFDSVLGALGYTVELLNAAGGTVLGTFFLNAATTTLAATVLLDNQSFGNYLVRVRAEEDAGPGDWSTPLDLTFVALPAPANLRVV